MSRPIRQVIRSRRTVHEFRPGSAPPRATIEAAIEHAVWAPNHYLSEPWRVRLLGPETAGRICELNAELVRAKQGDKAAEHRLQRWRTIPGWLLLSCRLDADEVRRREDYAACCCAAQNLMLYLWDEGIGVKWTTGSVVRDERFFDIVDMDPSQEQVVGLFWYGEPAEIPETARAPAGTHVRALP